MDEFRRALKLEAGNKEGDVLKYYDTKSTRKQVQYAVEFREKNLQAIAGRLTSLGELSQALLLQEWILSSPAEPAGLDNKMRDAMVKQFADGLRRALANSNPAVVAATCAVIEDVSTNARLQEPKQLDLRRLVTGLVPDLIKQTANSNVGVRAAAAQALGRVKGLARDVAPVLKKLLASGNEVVVRRAAAQAFLDQIQYLVTQVTMPPRENTRDSPLLREPRLREECRDFSIRALDAFTTLPGAGLADPEDPIRLLCTNTCGHIASGLRDQQLHENSQVSFPPLDRKLSRADIAFIRQQKEFADETFAFFRPEFKAFQDAAPAGPGCGGHKPGHSGVRGQRLQDLAVARRRMRNQLDAIPRNLPKPDEEKPKGDEKEKKKDVELPRFLPNPVSTTATNTAVVGQLVALQKDKDGADQGPEEPTGDDPVLAEPPQTLNALIESMLGSPDQRLRIDAVAAIEFMGRLAEPAIPGLIKALGDPSPFVRWGASRILGRLRRVRPRSSFPPWRSCSATRALMCGRARRRRWNALASWPPLPFRL